MEGEDSTVVLDDTKLGEVITDGSLGFDEWTSLISEVERAYPDNIEKICSVYDSFLLKFPLCYGYWRKYADHKIRLCTVDKVVEVFEKAVESATYSVAMWVDYCTFGSLVFEDPSDVRRLFKRSISFVGKDYLCHTLWDKYIDFEFSGKHWSSLANIYIQTLRFPTKKLHCYYDGFKKLVRILEEEMESYSNNTLEVSKESMLDDQVPTRYKQDEISCIIKDLLDPSLGLDRLKALQKYRYIGERFYQEASELNEKIIFFESRIKRSYFHVKPLDATQLENWHHYLDFAELHGDFDWIVKLYERCLIPCANYPEFWMRYVEYIESKGGREIANFALDRATQIFLKRVLAIHLFNARFKEHIGDVTNARATFLQYDRESDSAFVENVVMRANMERRLGNFIAASSVYKEALKMAVRKEKCHILPILYVHFSRLKYMTTDSEEAARDILMDGIKHVPFSKLLIEELIIFSMTHKGSEHINEVDSVVAKALSPEPGVSQGLSVKDREDISSQYLKFVDLCGTLHDVSNAWSRHVKLFPQAVRTTTYHTAAGKKQWKIATESRRETLAALPLQPSGHCNSDKLIRSSLQDNEQSLVENHDSEASLPDTDQVPGQRSPFLENHNMLSDQATVNLHQPGESENNLQENLHQKSLRVSEPPREGASGPILSFDLAHQVSNEANGAQASLEFSNEIVQRESDHGPKLDLMPPSLEMLSPDSQDSKSPGLVIQNSEAPHKISSFFPSPPEGKDPQERSLSNRSISKSEASPGNAMTNGNMPESQNANVDLFVSSPMSIRGTLSEQITTGNASPSSSASNQNITTQAFSQPRMPANSGRNWHQRSNFERNRRDSRFWNRGHSHRRMHQRRQSSPQRQYSQAETGSQMHNSQGCSSQLLSSQSSQVQQGSQVQSQFAASSAPANPMAPQAWSMHNMQQQNSSSAYPSQPTGQPGTYPQAQMSQYPMQSNEQQGNVQGNQAYNQMWQYYYCQQQQQFLWQQQQQMQQQPQQQQFMQQYQQQLLQLQYLQQQQLQQQQLPYQQPQLQQLQHQQLQQQLMQQQQQPYQLQQQPNMQQEFQQQHFLYMQQQQQQYMQSQMQLQQHQHQHQQHHQQQTLLPPQQDGQRQPEQQTDTSHVEASQQVQGTSAHTKDTSGSMGSPHPQQHSPDSQ